MTTQKSDIRAAMTAAVQAFQQNGGVVTLIKSRKAPKVGGVRAKTTRASSTGSSGFSSGYPTRSFA